MQWVAQNRKIIWRWNVFFEVVIWSRRYRSALCQWDRQNMVVIHRGPQQGRSPRCRDQFRQLPPLVPRPSRRNCCVFYQKKSLRPDIRRTRWSSRPDTVFLLESWGLLTDLPRSRPHTAPGYWQVVYRRCCFPRICYYDHVQNCTVHILFRQFLPSIPDDQLCSFSTVDCPADRGSCCRRQICYMALLLRVLYYNTR